MKEKYLPIGTVCLLKEATKKVMIIGYFIKAEKEGKPYDYLGCLYPEGNIFSKKSLLFNHENISEICHMGLESHEFKIYESKLKELYEKNDTDVEFLSVSKDSSTIFDLGNMDISTASIIDDDNN